MVNMQGRYMTLEKADFSQTTLIKTAPSNYFRNMAMPEEVISESREFIISKDSLGVFGDPSRGDRLIDDDLKINTIREIKEMYDLGGAVIGFRVRTG